MQLDIQALNFSLTSALKHHIRRRLGFALSSISEQMRHVTIRLSDINGPRGGKDKLCHVHIALNGVSDVVIEDTETDMYNAINRAIDRAGRTVSRRVGRQREMNRARISQELSSPSL